MRRRDFIGRLVLLSGSIGFSESLEAAPGKTRIPLDRHSDRILVVIELAGGCDGLNTLVPFRNDVYFRRRPSLAIPAARVLRLDDVVGLHPSMPGLRQLFERGKVAIIQGVGYPEPDRSHFRSQQIWQTGCLDSIGRRGWLAESSWLNVASTSSSAIDLTGNAARKRISGVPDSLLDPIQLTNSRRTYRTSIEYPANLLAQNLKAIAQMIAADLGIAVFCESLGGFDTHVQQISSHSPTRGQHALLLETLSAALRAFFEDLERMGRAQDVLIMTFSEFGRHPAENGRLGTDHGTANQMFLISSSLIPGLYGIYPGLEDVELDGTGDLVFTVDFRRVYSTILSKWLGVNPDVILGASFPDLEFL